MSEYFFMEQFVIEIFGEDFWRIKKNDLRNTFGLPDRKIYKDIGLTAVRETDISRHHVYQNSPPETHRTSQHYSIEGRKVWGPSTELGNFYASLTADFISPSLTGLQ